MGELAEVPEFLAADDVFGTPTYWWPKDRSWCLCTDWDLIFTLVGGSTELTDAIVNDDFLESVIVSRDSRVDYKGDKTSA